MTGFQQVRELVASGQYASALRTLEGRPLLDRLTGDLFRIELLERVGQHSEARELAEQIGKRRALSPDAKSTCEFVLARIEWDAGNTDNAILHFQRAVTHASQSEDRALLCWRQMWLWQVLCEKTGVDAAATHLAELRSNVIRVGDPRLTAAGHIFVGKMEAKRGGLGRAELHTNLGQRFLRGSPNCLLSALAETTHVALAILRCDFESGLEHASLALDCSEQSGVATVIRASLGNFGNLYYLNGEFAKAAEFFERAMQILPIGENAYAGMDTLAKIRLLQGQYDECSRLLNTVEESIRTPADRRLYLYRHTLLTRAALFARQKRWKEANEVIERVLNIATQAGDKILTMAGLLAHAESLQQLGDNAACLSILTDVVSRPESLLPLDMYARYEQLLAGGLAAEGRAQNAAQHLFRARGVYQSLRNVPGLIELTYSNNEDTNNTGTAEPFNVLVDLNEDNQIASTVQSMSVIMTYTDNPEVTARELVQVVTKAKCAEYVCARSQERDGTQQILVAQGSDQVRHGLERHLKIGDYRGRSIELLIVPKTDLESTATVNAITLVIGVAQELHRSRIERQDRAPLWPADDLNVSREGAVISGRMRELMTFARRVARTTVGVLITGESGTGKEILARAVHTFSDRAQKPFVPVNCAAVPRELLESHLFGHRRGAFTGADRDHTGFIRAARDGTLFLDEVAELGLELQPKLLRFLESGEIAPLGEPAPLTVNVRIIAATNHNLEELVRQGRFREDLFYRLNVVPLHIPPLRERRDEVPGMVSHFVRRAAEEFHKGHLTVAEETMERLLLYRWPGNVRQLQNELRRIVALAEPNSTLLPDMISEDILGAMPLLRPGQGREFAVSLHDKLPLALRKIECEMIKIALREHRGKVDAAAKALGISRKGLYLKRQRLGL